MRCNFIQKYPGITSIPQPDDDSFVRTDSDNQFLYWLSRVASWRVALNVEKSGIATFYTGTIADGQFLNNGVEERPTYLNEAYKAVPQGTNLIDAFDTDFSNQISVEFGQSCFVRTLSSSYNLKFGFLALLFTIGAQLTRSSAGFGFEPSDVSGTFDGVPFPLYDNTAGTLSGVLSIEPELWWPYARPDGSFPIYSETSNTQFIPSSDPEFISFLGQT